MLNEQSCRIRLLSGRSTGAVSYMSWSIVGNKTVLCGHVRPSFSIRFYPGKGPKDLNKWVGHILPPNHPTGGVHVSKESSAGVGDGVPVTTPQPSNPASFPHGVMFKMRPSVKQQYEETHPNPGSPVYSPITFLHAWFTPTPTPTEVAVSTPSHVSTPVSDVHAASPSTHVSTRSPTTPSGSPSLGSTHSSTPQPDPSSGVSSTAGSSHEAMSSGDPTPTSPPPSTLPGAHNFTFANPFLPTTSGLVHCAPVSTPDSPLPSPAQPLHEPVSEPSPDPYSSEADTSVTGSVSSTESLRTSEPVTVPYTLVGIKLKDDARDANGPNFNISLKKYITY